MSHSLSVILPACNAEAKLASVVYQLLDVTSELTSDLELVIVDDGSSDGTIEVAMDLKRLFPQIRVIRHTQPAGKDSAVTVGLAATRGDVVLIHNINAPFSGEAIRELWTMRSHERDMLFARMETTQEGKAVPVVHSKPACSGGTQLIRRDSLPHDAPSPVGPKKVAPPVKPARGTVQRTDDGGAPSASPAIFHQHPNVEMQPDR